MLQKMPTVPVDFVPAKGGEKISLGAIQLRVMEDGSHTGKLDDQLAFPQIPFSKIPSPDNRIGAAEFTVPPHTPGPPAHWHEMHDETFLVTKGTIRFHIPGKPDVDAKVGDYVVVPIRSPHTFSNPFDEEGIFFNTYTPAFYINYFKLLASMLKEGETMTKEKNLEAMANYATLPVPPGEVTVKETDEK
ncbi:RmlC-like cupin [Aulographum hederae CBS 113979]|uniref:RmlC-like cupin n=1 Tax=Aulographum hederae CBS 113979 TaxID=1176131 RepID=A0A6G1GZU5_9PEZI|nr:RmlC-like cupin [Aulographum hederae CBS 113979]